MADFGLAIDPPQGQDQNYHDKYTYQGTIHYLTPEQLNGPYTLRRNVSRPWISVSKSCGAAFFDERHALFDQSQLPR
jgi:serine/threonine protein kinase